MIQVGNQHVDCDAQFQYINTKAQEFINAENPVISTDTKKKEPVGDFKNGGAEYRPAKSARKVLDHDFPLPEVGKVSPYGVYLVNKNAGFVNLGTDHDTSAFAGERIRRWWNIVGKPTYLNAKSLYINCDGGGSNGWRTHLWKYELAMLAHETGLEIYVSHYPPGTSKWNKIEYRLFCYITKKLGRKTTCRYQYCCQSNLINNYEKRSGSQVRC